MNAAKSIAAGFAIAAGALAITYAVLAVAYADRPAYLDHWFYRELVGWQTGLGAFFGLLGLAAVAAWNFKKTRDRDKEIGDEEARALARVICREMLEIRGQCSTIHGRITDLTAATSLPDKGVYEYFQFPIVNVYEKLATKLGILPLGLIDGVFAVYATVFNIQQAADHFIRHVDVSRDTLKNLDRRVQKLSNRIESVAPGLGLFAGFTIPDDYFRKSDIRTNNDAADMVAAMAPEAATDEADQTA